MCSSVQYTSSIFSVEQLSIILKLLKNTKKTIKNLKEYDIVMLDNMDELSVNVHDVGINVVNFFDKTKDMPTNGLMAFCTFYKDSEKYTNVNSYTKLKFRLKDCVKDEKYAKMFNVVLYPHFAFFMSLSTNRLYTHEISPLSAKIHKCIIRHLVGSN